MINLSHAPKIVKKEGNKAVFEIEALHPGYGVTIGNSLRRILLSSLEGAAVTQVKIKGVSHEFSTIPGILEDVITIMLNLKQLRFKLFSDEPQKATLKVKGERIVKGSDFKLSSQVELANKNCHIATLSSRSAELEMEIQIEKGIGYSSRETRKKTAGSVQEKLEIGAILLDASFTPVKRVTYRVENMRVGERTDFDRLFLEIETDGIIEPEQAFLQASEILISHFSLFADSFRPKVGLETKKVEEKKKITKKPKKEKPVSKKTKNEKKKKGEKTK